MQRTRTIIRFVCVVCFTSLGSSLLAATPAEQDLLKEVQDGRERVIKKIETVECDFRWGRSADRQCRYARSGEKYYAASITSTQAGNVSIPVEAAWNGKQAFYREDIEYLALGTSRDLANPRCRFPDTFDFSSDALPWGRNGEAGGELLSAKALQIDNQRVIELQVRTRIPRPTGDQRMVVRYAADQGYWPISGARDFGKSKITLTGVRIVKIGEGDATIYFPVAFTTTTFDPRLAAPQAVSCEVDEKTLKVNEPIPDERFAITPWPNQSVYDKDANKWQKPANPNWLPDNKVGFPFGPYIESMNNRGLPLKALTSKPSKPSKD